MTCSKKSTVYLCFMDMVPEKYSTNSSIAYILFFSVLQLTYEQESVSFKELIYPLFL